MPVATRAALSVAAVKCSCAFQCTVSLTDGLYVDDRPRDPAEGIYNDDDTLLQDPRARAEAERAASVQQRLQLVAKSNLWETAYPTPARERA